MDNDLAERIASSFDSVWSLELLLLLYDARTRSWTAADIVQELRSSALVVRQSIIALKTAGLVEEAADGTVRYMPASAELDGFVQRLDQEYRWRPATVRRLIIGDEPR